MLSSILPRRIDNTYRGQVLALWLFVPVVLMKTAIALATIFNGRVAAQSADGIPLNAFTAAGAQTVVAMFAAWGLSQLVISAIAILVLIRYRSAVALMFALLLLEHLCRRLIFLAIPVPRAGAPPGTFVNFALLGAMIVGLVLSLWTRSALRLPVPASRTSD